MLNGGWSPASVSHPSPNPHPPTHPRAQDQSSSGTVLPLQRWRRGDPFSLYARHLVVTARGPVLHSRGLGTSRGRIVVLSYCGSLGRSREEPGGK